MALDESHASFWGPAMESNNYGNPTFTGDESWPGFAGGLPIGAVLVKQHVADSMKPGDHGSTFAGNPLVTRAAETVVDIISGAHEHTATPAPHRCLEFVFDPPCISAAMLRARFYVGFRSLLLQIMCRCLKLSWQCQVVSIAFLAWTESQLRGRCYLYIFTWAYSLM